MTLLCLGALAIDDIKTPFGSAKGVLGGAAAYFAFSAGFFSKTALVSSVGRDFPAGFRKRLEKRADLKGVQKSPLPNFRSECAYSFDLYSRTVGVKNLEALGALEPRVPAEFAKSKFVFLATTTPAQQEMLLDQVEPEFCAVDTIELYIQTQLPALKRVLRRADCFVLNDVEARMLSREHNLLKAGRKIQELGPDTVLVKKGEHGSILFHGGEAFPFSAFPLEEVEDPTGAGDSFAGGFMGRIAEKGRADAKTMREAVAFANVMGSFCVEDFGTARLERLTRAEIDKRKDYYEKLVLF